MMSTNELVLELDDRVSAPINKMIGSINEFVNEVRFAGDVVNNSFTSNSIVNMSQEFNTAVTRVDNFTDSISNAASQQDSFNNSVKKSEGIASKAFSVFKDAIGVNSWSDGVKKIVDMSDKYTQMSTKLSSITGEGENLADIQNKIFGSANSGRTSYTAMADAVSQFGKEAKSAFGSTDEIIGFADSVNKSFAIGGLGESERTSAMSYVSDSMSDGNISGDELNEIMSYSPVIGESLSEYMGVPENLVQEYANEGKLSAEAFKNAVLSSSGEINSQFSALPATWGEIWTILGNFATKALTPILTVVSWLASNFSLLAPIILGVAAAFAVFQLTANWTKMASMATSLYYGAVNFLSIGFGILKGSTAAASAATFQYNSALLSCPITWIIMLIILLIGIIYAAVAAYNKFTGSTVSATGIIMGIFSVLVAFVMNQLIYLWNIFAAFANFIGNFCNDPVAAVKILFLDMAETVLGYVQTMVKGIEDLINKIPGVQIDITSGIDQYLDKIRNAAKEIKDESGWKEYVKKQESQDFADVFSKSYDDGKGLVEKVSSFIGGEGVGEIEPSGFVPAGGNSFDTTGGMGDALNNIATDTSAISNEVTTSAENEEYLRKIAERDVIVRYVAPNINVKMNNQNNIRNGMDVDGVIDHLARGTAAAMAGMVEGA